jgi:sugar phosphate permease
MWFLPLSFFAYQFILRLWPGLMMQQIMGQFSIDASQFGLLAACYYYGYAGMQIPVAILLERFSVRVIVFCFALLCGVATLMFTYTSHFYVALLSRFLVGVGSSVGFLAVSKVISEWFVQKHYARMVGFSFTIGLLGAIYGGKPVNVLIDTYSWQGVASTLASVSMLIGSCAYLILRSPKQFVNASSESQFRMHYVKELLTSPTLWCLALANLLMVGALEGFADVWGVSYLMTAHALHKSDAASLVSFIFVGMLVGGPLLAWCSRKCGNYVVIILCGLGMALAFLFLLTCGTYSRALFSFVFFLIGIMCCYQVIVFATGATLVTPAQLGVTVAFLNSINMFGGSFFHTMIGKIMDIFWAGQLDHDGLRLYHLDAYHHALAVIPCAAVLGAVLIAFIGWRQRLMTA